jgi:hypothetical protein
MEAYGKLDCSFGSKTKFIFSFFNSKFEKFLVIKILDPDWIRIGFQPKLLDLDPDPYKMNTYGSETLPLLFR